MKTKSTEWMRYKRERDLLAKSLGELLVALGHCEDVPMTGAQLCAFADERAQYECDVANGVQRCEGCNTELPEGTAHYDGEGVPLCDECWGDVLNDAATEAEARRGG